MDSDWIEMSRSPIARECPDAPVIVWHVYSGAMVERLERAMKNRFMTHWREIDNGAWIDARERKPTQEDADAYDCVISQDVWGEVAMAGWHRFDREPRLARWQTPPPAPPNICELRNRIR